MTEFESATIAYQQASLHLGYWQMIATFLQAGLGFLIGVVQCALIYVGLRRMGQASDERKGQHEEAMQAMQTQHEETMRALDVQREATMHALRELIARTAR